ncbi:SpoIIE family protein phosphatase [Conexibacter sp. SYSU D00693]|uniref:ATP-binding SpoIIE family protein phosphatase n=1 Tax=Conexibacter sp. SYSU D00693 TaxID=2812560 RepID=UPI00196AF81F|nr:SpoIIE family protein phosphatase [Conexibacter sp. SYSU D00693]
MAGASRGTTAPARALGFLFSGGSALGLLTLALDRHDETPVAGSAALAVAAFLSGLVMLLRPRLAATRLRVDALCAAGTLFIALACVIAGPSPYAVMFVWTGVFAAAYLPRTAWLHIGLIAVLLPAVHVAADHQAEHGVARSLIVLGVIVMASLVVGRLLDRLEEQGRAVGLRATTLARSEDRLRAMLESSQDGFVAVDDSTTIIDCNATLARMLGAEQREELLGQPWVRFLAEEERATVEERRQRALVAGAEPEPYQLHLRRVDGSTVRTLLHASVLDVGGERLVAAFVRDLTLVDVVAREHRIAETLQRSLLPQRLPDLPGVHLAARYVPAAAEADVGGDWFDALELPGGRLALAMGDVAGKGLAAAASVGRLRSALRAYVLEHEDPAIALDRLERAVELEGEALELTTVALAVVDVERRDVRWASAGHPPPLLLEGGEGRFLEGGTGAPIGAGTSRRRRSASAPLGPDATLVLYTDGLVERRQAPIQEGLERLRDTARRLAGEGPEAVLDGALQAAEVMRGGADDVALLAARVQPLGDRLELALPTRPDELARMRAALRRWLAEQERTDADLLLAVAEAATNAVEHSRGDEAAEFQVTAWREDLELVVEVRSPGRWREREEGRVDRGRGLAMMERLVDELDVRREPEATTVRLVRRIAG